MKKVLLSILMICPLIMMAQSIEKIDEVADEMCEYLHTLDYKSDQRKIETFYSSKFYPYLSQFNEKKAEKIGMRLFYRMQRNCREFIELLDRLNPPMEGVERITEKPTPEISTEDLEGFKNRQEFYYYEANGDTTFVTMKDGIWQDDFVDDTYSKLSYEWVSEHEFVLIFIRSNNETRENLSVKGDEFVYQVLGKEEDHYRMSVHIPGQTTWELFKIYFKD